jgi:hypothetical protein
MATPPAREDGAVAEVVEDAAAVEEERRADARVVEWRV